MPATPYLVLDRCSKRVLYQSQNLQGARGFSEAREEPTTIAMVAEAWAETEWRFVFRLVNGETGDLIAESQPMDFDDAADLMFCAKLLLVPACLPGKAVTP